MMKTKYYYKRISNGVSISNQMKYYYALPPQKLIYTVLWSVTS